MRVTPEGRIKNAIRKTLKKFPSVYAFWPVQTGYGNKTLDVLLCVNAFFFAIEAKAPGKVPTALQEVTIADMQRAGGVVIVIDSIEKAQVDLFNLICNFGGTSEYCAG